MFLSCTFCINTFWNICGGEGGGTGGEGGGTGGEGGGTGGEGGGTGGEGGGTGGEGGGTGGGTGGEGVGIQLPPLQDVLAGQVFSKHEYSYNKNIVNREMIKTGITIITITPSLLTIFYILRNNIQNYYNLLLDVIVKLYLETNIMDK